MYLLPSHSIATSGSFFPCLLLSYTSIVVSFIGWDQNGTVQDTINCANTSNPAGCTPQQLKWRFNASTVKQLQAQHRSVFVR